MSPSDHTSEIKSKIDLVEFVQQYIPLKKRGINYLGLCPFHDEKTPSFTVSPERQTFKCFGCGHGGDVFSFLMEKEGLDFAEALQTLADKTGVKLPEFRGQVSNQPQKKGLFDLNELCARFWHKLLLEHQKAQPARDYLLKKRGLTKELIERFTLGLAPRNQTTTEILTKKGFSPEQIRQAGDPPRFAGRITFPIADLTGRVVGFTGRLLPSAEKEVSGPVGPKYWNTPETAIFKKSEVLYGLHLAKESIRKSEVVIMAEGQMDVIGLHQVGLTQAVASSGTALTEQQAKLLSRFAKEITFAYDADKAGESAAERGFHIALAADLNPTVMQLPPGEDPGSLAAKKPHVLTRSYESRQPVIAWLLTLAIKQNGTAQPAAKKKITKAVLPWVAKINDAVERYGWLDVIAEQVGTSTDALREELAKLDQANVLKARPKPSEPEKTINKPQPLTLIFGILGNHPSLIEPLKHLDRLVQNTEWQPILSYLKGEPKTLERTSSNQLNEAIMTAEQEFAGAALEELGHEITLVYQRAIAAHNAALKQQLTSAINQAEAAGQKDQVNSLMQQLASANIQEDD